MSDTPEEKVLGALFGGLTEEEARYLAYLVEELTPPEVMARFKKRFPSSKWLPENKQEPKYVVRLYDGFDHNWIDVSKPGSREEAEKVWNEETKDGTVNTKFEDIDYYAIFPADTAMKFSEQGRKGYER